MFPIRILEGGSIAAVSGEIVAEVPGGYEVAKALVLGANNYSAVVALLKKFVAGESPVAEAKSLLGYLGEAA